MTGGPDTPSRADTYPSADAALDARIGSIVGKYVIVRLMGKGGMGAVYEARHGELSRRFAIKFLLPEFAANRDLLSRFEREAKVAGGLEHPNLVAVTDVGRTNDGSPYLVMEFLQGEDCAELLRRLGPLPVPRAADLVVQACRGLVIAHRAGIVHRDLKPENLFVTDAGDGSDRVKVLDFGIAQILSPDRSRVTRTGAALGTAYYMSPEQARAAGDLDARTDVWSLGVVLYELLSGRRPFEGERFLYIIHEILNADPPPLQTLRAGLPPELAALVQRAMSKNVTDRLPSVAAFAEALAPFAGRPSALRHALPNSDRTQGTPATVASSHVPTGAGRTGMTSAKSEPLLVATAPRSTLTRWAAAGLVVTGMATTGAIALRPRTHLEAGDSGGSLQAPVSVSQQAATAAGAIVPDTRTILSVSGIPQGPPPSPQTPDAGIPMMSGLSEQSSNKRAGLVRGPRVQSWSPASLPTAVPPQALSAEPAKNIKGSPIVTPHHTKIDRDNPY